MNIWDGVTLAAVAGIVYLAFRQIRKNRNSGKCPGGCEGCCQACAKKEQKA